MTQAQLSPRGEGRSGGQDELVAGLRAQSQPPHVHRERVDQPAVPGDAEPRQRAFALQRQARRSARQQPATDPYGSRVQRRGAHQGPGGHVVHDPQLAPGVTGHAPDVQVGRHRPAQVRMHAGQPQVVGAAGLSARTARAVVERAPRPGYRQSRQRVGSESHVGAETHAERLAVPGYGAAAARQVPVVAAAPRRETPWAALLVLHRHQERRVAEGALQGQLLVHRREPRVGPQRVGPQRVGG